MTEDVLHRLGIRIRTLREQKNTSQESLGYISRLHRTYVGAIERGERNPTVLSLRQLLTRYK